MVKLEAWKDAEGNIVIKEDSFDHLLACLDNQKFVGKDFNADATEMSKEELDKVSYDNQKAINDFNRQCRELQRTGRTLKQTDGKIKTPSEAFKHAFHMPGGSGAGSMWISCEHCGREHYADLHSCDFEEGEFEGLENRNKKNPDRTVAHNFSSVAWCYLDGRQYVIDCQCNAGRKYENFIWKHRQEIRDYIVARTTEIFEDANREKESLKFPS